MYNSTWSSNIQLKLIADLTAPFLAELLNRSLSTVTVPKVSSRGAHHATAQEPDLDSADPRSTGRFPIYRWSRSLSGISYSESSATCLQQPFCRTSETSLYRDSRAESTS